MTVCVALWHSEPQQLIEANPQNGKCVKVRGAKLAEYEWGISDVDESHFEQNDEAVWEGYYTWQYLSSSCDEI